MKISGEVSAISQDKPTTTGDIMRRLTVAGKDISFFARTVEELDDLTQKVRPGDRVELDVVEKGGYLNAIDQLLILGRGVSEAGTGFKGGDQLTALDDIIDEGAVIQDKCLQACKKNLGGEWSGSDGDKAMVNSLFIWATKEKYWRNQRNGKQ